MEDTKKLSDLRPQEKARVHKIAAGGALRRKFLDMGILPGSELEVIKVAPLGDPIDIKVKGYHLSLRKDEAKDILVKV